MVAAFSAIRVRLFALLLFLGCVGPAAAQSAAGGALGGPARATLDDSPATAVQDHAGLFRPETVAQARLAIQKLRDDYHRDLFVETFAQVPSEDLRHVKALSRKRQESYFAEWAERRARALGLDGIYVLICKEPRHVQVVVRPDTPEQAFPAADRRELRARLERKLRKTPDEALLDAVAQVRSALQTNLEAQAAAPGIGFGTVVTIVLIVLGAWVVLALLRLLFQGAPGAAPGEAPRVEWASALLGGMFGTAAGHWIYDRLFRARGVRGAVDARRDLRRFAREKKV